jgi:hypothetical protein
MPIIGVTGSQNTKSFLNPNPPTIGTATDVGTSRAFNNGAATVTFTAAVTGAAATSFTATSSPGGYTATGASSPLTVTGLQSGTAYTFTVVASNSVGPSLASSASNSITATTVPQAPTMGTVTKNTSATGRLNVPYSAPANNGGKAITSYTITSSPGSFTSSAASPILFTGLTPGTSYSFTATATNANGTSAASTASNSVAASQYVCSVGSVSGSNCVYNASSQTNYTCPNSGGWVICGCNNYQYNYPACYAGPDNWCTFVSHSNQVTCFSGPFAQINQGFCQYYQQTCGTTQNYVCPQGGNLSGSTCYLPAQIG